MSTSRDSFIGLPLSRVSRTANSRARSARMRAIRKRYLPRSAPGKRPHGPSKAVRAARTANSTSATPASLTSARTSSEDGLMVLKLDPSVDSTNSPPMNSPYDGRMVTTVRDSSAGAYSNLAIGVSAFSSVDRHVVGTGVMASGQLLPLQKKVVEQAGGPETEPGRVDPVIAGDLVDHHQVLQRVLGCPDAPSRLHPDLGSGERAPVAHRLEHHQRDGRCGGRRYLARRGLDEVRARQHGQPCGAAHVVVGHQLAGLKDDLEVRRGAMGPLQGTLLPDRRDLVEHLEVPAGQERPTVDDHVDLMRTGPQCVAGVGELDRHRGPTRREG